MSKLYNISGIPGVSDSGGISFDDKIDFKDIEDIVKYVIKEKVLFNPIGVHRYSDISSFDTSYLEAAAVKGTPENEFFNKYVKGILDSMGKESDPASIIDFYRSEIEGLKSGAIAPGLLQSKSGRSRVLPYILSTYKHSRSGADVEEIPVDSDGFKKTVKHLEDNGSFINDFGGEIQSHPKSDVSKSVIKIAEQALKYKEEGNLKEAKRLRLLIDSIYKSHESKIGARNSKVKVPILLNIKGLKDPNTGEELGGENSKGVKTAFILEVPRREKFLKIKDLISGDGEYGTLVPDKNSKKEFLDNYLNPKDIKKYSIFNNDFNEINSLLLDLRSIQKSKSNKGDIRTSWAGVDRFEGRHGRITDLDMLINSLSRSSNKSDIKSVYDLADSYGEPDVKNFLKQMIEDTKRSYGEEIDYSGNVKVRGKGDLDVLIPYKDMIDTKYYAIGKNGESTGYESEGGSGDDSYIFDAYEKAFNKMSSNEKDIDEKDIEGYNPFKSRDKKQDAVNKTLTKQEIYDRRYLGYNLAAALINKDVKRLRKYITSDENGNLSNIKNSIVEHVVPITEMFNFLWVLFVEMMQSEKYTEDDIKKIIVNYVRDLYKEAIIDQDIDRQRLMAAGHRDTSSDMLSRYRKSIDSGNMSDNDIWKRYKISGISSDRLPIKISDVKKQTGDRLEGVTYQDIADKNDIIKPQTFEESKQPKITNLLFGYYG